MLFNDLQIAENLELAQYLVDVRVKALATASAIKAQARLDAIYAMADEVDEQDYGFKAARKRSEKCVSKAERRYFRK